MLKFKREQKIFEVGKVKVGGQPGENPTVLVGSIFYHGQKIVQDEKKGEVNKEKAEALIKLQEEFSDKTGNPCMLDVVGSTEEAMRRFIEFVGDVTDMPFLVDSSSVKVKVAGIKYVREIGLEKRVVYNSLTPDSKQEEFEALKENKVESAIILAYKKGVMTSKARIEAIQEVLPKAEEAGITKPLLDTFVLDIPSLSLACRAMLNLKGELGFPCGCGAHNAISTWIGLKERMGTQAVKSCAVTVNVVPIVLGADFILYGPIEDCNYVFPTVYAVNTSYKYLYKMGEQLQIS
jgi:tetrahydromethanopterin S-methyltransferase subunit H